MVRVSKPNIDDMPEMMSMVFISCHKAHFSRLLLVRVCLRPLWVKLQKLLDRQEFFLEGQRASLTAMNSVSTPRFD